MNTVVFVLGAGRSGTSVLTRILSLCGGNLPGHLMEGNGANPKGYWEPIEVLCLNTQFLLDHDTTWFDPTLTIQEEHVIDKSARDGFIKKICQFFETLQSAAPLIIKEPRITALGDLWTSAAQRAGFDVRVVIAVRRPVEVVLSLEAQGVRRELATILWLKYNLLAERYSRHLPRVFVEYSKLLEDWRSQLSRIERVIPIRTSAATERLVDDLVETALYRNRSDEPMQSSFGTAWVDELYSAFHLACGGEAVDSGLLDSLYLQYRSSERMLRLALEESRSWLHRQRADFPKLLAMGREESAPVL